MKYIIAKLIDNIFFQLWSYINEIPGPGPGPGPGQTLERPIPGPGQIVSSPVPAKSYPRSLTDSNRCSPSLRLLRT